MEKLLLERSKLQEDLMHSKAELQESKYLVHLGCVCVGYTGPDKSYVCWVLVLQPFSPWNPFVNMILVRWSFCLLTLLCLNRGDNLTVPHLPLNWHESSIRRRFQAMTLNTSTSANVLLPEVYLDGFQTVKWFLPPRQEKVIQLSQTWLFVGWMMACPPSRAACHHQEFGGETTRKSLSEARIASTSALDPRNTCRKSWGEIWQFLIELKWLVLLLLLLLLQIKIEVGMVTINFAGGDRWLALSQSKDLGILP